MNQAARPEREADQEGEAADGRFEAAGDARGHIKGRLAGDAPQLAAEPERRCGNGVAVAGFTMSAVSLVFVLPGIGVVLAVLSGAMSGVGVYKSKRGAPHGALAVAGVTISVIALLVSIVVTSVFAYFWSDLADWIDNYERNR